MRVRTLLCLSVLCVTLPGCGKPVQSGSLPIHIQLGTGTLGGGFYGFGQAIAAIIAKTHPDFQIDVQVTGGAVANVEAINRGDLDTAFTFADVAYLASVGDLTPSHPPLDQVRAIGVVQVTPVQLVAAKDAPIRTVADLRGLRVAVGPEGSGTALTARLLLQAFGLTPSMVRTESLEFQEAGSRLMNGHLDAMFDNATYADSIARALTAGARLIPIEGPPVERLRREYPFLRSMNFPKETYPATGTFRTLGVDSLLICRMDLDERVVYALTTAIFEALGELAQTGRWNLASPDQAPAAPIPLHEGAARYYREQELVR
jgi:TRAP transporter TAXI family solute receptor